MILDRFKIYYISVDSLKNLGQDDELREYIRDIYYERVSEPFPTSLLYDMSFEKDFYKFEINSAIAYCAYNAFKQIKKQSAKQFQQLFNVSEKEYNDLIIKLLPYKPVSRSKDYYLHPLSINY